MELREKDPEAFKARITELRNSAQKRLDTLQAEDPEAYERVMRRREKRIEPRFERMREEDPEAFERVLQHHEGLKQKRLEWFRTHDPARFEMIEKRREMMRMGGRPEALAPRFERPMNADSARQREPGRGAWRPEAREPGERWADPGVGRPGFSGPDRFQNDWQRQRPVGQRRPPRRNDR